MVGISTSYYFRGMTESIKISKDVAESVRQYKAKTGISIRIFIEKAINEKLKRLKSRKKL